MAKKPKTPMYVGDPRISHIPIGDMCLTCTKLHDNCSGLRFREMPRKSVDKYDGTTYVICKEFLNKRKTNE
jgi:hypothetical protein